MSSRSKRQPKPTTKFLAYCSADKSSTKNVLGVDDKSPGASGLELRKIEVKEIEEKLKSIKEEMSETKIKSENDDHNILDTSSCSSTSSDVRRSARKSKPSSKLQDYVSGSNAVGQKNNAEPRRRTVCSALNASKVPRVLLLDKDIVDRKTILAAKKEPTKKVAAIIPNQRESMSETEFLNPVGRQRSMTNLPVSKTKSDHFSKPTTSFLRKRKDSLPETSTNVRRSFVPTVRKFTAGANYSNASSKLQSQIPKSKQPLSGFSQAKMGLLSKQAQQIVSKKDQNNLGKTLMQSKTTRQSNPIKGISSSGNKRPISFTSSQPAKRLKKLDTISKIQKETKNILESVSESEGFTDQSEAENETDSIHLSSEGAEDNDEAIIKTGEKAQEVNEHLEKFILMGKKVCTVINETLELHEDDLVGKISSFEQKCLDLVEGLCNSGVDIDDQTLDKVIQLLETEQKERMAYRQAFLRNLKESHKTNMKIYNQMLGFLKSY